MRRLVVGLGNPGESYLRTRHNVGFRVVDRLVDLHGVGGLREECGAWVRSKGPWIFSQPRTFMNRSGSAVRCLCELHGLETPAVLVIYDDIHLPLGRLRLRAGGSAAGHRGLESTIEALQTEAIPRLRLGIGGPPPGLGEEGLADYVLGPFLAEEEPVVSEMIERAALAVGTWLTSGIDAAMNLANTPPPPQGAGGMDDPKASAGSASSAGSGGSESPDAAESGSTGAHRSAGREDPGPNSPDLPPGVVNA